MSVVPEVLDFNNAPIMNGTTTSIGYAEFVLPYDEAMILESTASSGLAVIGWTDSVHLAFMKPFDPSAPDPTADEYRRQLAALPSNHPLRLGWLEDDLTFLDIEINLEHMTPDPLWRLLVQDKNTFVINTTKLMLKGLNVRGGMNSVYTYDALNTRGLVRVGRSRDDTSIAFAFIESRDGTKAVGIIMRRRNDDMGDIMPHVTTVLSSLRFTAQHLA